MILKRVLLAVLACAVLLAVVARPVYAADATDAGIVRLPAEPLVIETAAGKQLTFQAEVADTGTGRARGMMFRKSMELFEAMLFIWPQPYEAAMWMRNTFIPLDMLFITPDGRIVYIARNAVPHSLDVITAARPVLAVLEIRGGAAAQLGISAGDLVRHRYFAAP